MPTLGIVGAVQRTDPTMTRDEEMLSSNITVADDSLDHMEIPTLGIQAVGFGSISAASFVFIKSDKFLNITLTKVGNITLAPVSTRILWLEETQIAGISLENPNAEKATVRVILGGA